MNISTQNMWLLVFRRRHRRLSKYFTIRNSFVSYSFWLLSFVYITNHTNGLDVILWEIFRTLSASNTIIIRFNWICLQWFSKNCNIIILLNQDQHCRCREFIVNGFTFSVSPLLWPAIQRQVAKCISFSKSIFSPLEEFRYSFFVFFYFTFRYVLLVWPQHVSIYVPLSTNYVALHRCMLVYICEQRTVQRMYVNGFMH